VKFKSSRLRLFLVFFTAGVVFYLMDCLFNFKEHPDLPWYETGIYETTPRGFILNMLFILFAIAQLFYGRRD